MIIGLFFGSFNPIHNGHINIAKEVIKKTDVEKILMVLSPQSPEKKEVISKDKRLELMEIALRNTSNISVSTIEFDMQVPNYTFKTLKKISNDFPSEKFKIIMGDDNYYNIDNWKESDFILNNYEIIIYPRTKKSSACIFSKKIFNISSSQIRLNIKNNRSIKNLVPIEIEKKIRLDELYC